MKRLIVATLMLIISCSYAFADDTMVVVKAPKWGVFKSSVGQGLSDGDALWLSAPLLKVLGCDATEDLPGKRIWISAPKNFPLPAPLPGGEKLRLNLPGKVPDGHKVVYVRIAGLEPLLGITATPQDGGSWLIEKAPAELPPASRPVPIDRASLPEKFLMVWDHVTRGNPNLSAEGTVPGLDVISPTWFSVLADGEVLNSASIEYVQDAHRHGYQVWALVNNNGFNSQNIGPFLKNSRAMDRAVARICAMVELYDIDGINMDFEAFDPEDRDGYTMFIRKLATRLKAMGRWSSVDVTVITPWKSSNRYDRKALGEAVDYVMLMAYDEHWRTSPKAGSVASLPWVERGVARLLHEVPASKLVLGVPFYTRQWTETPKSGGGVSVKSATMSMGAAQNAIAKRASALAWLPAVGQNYMEYHEGNKKIRVWIEDATSMAARVRLAHQYGLPGIAAWRKGFELPSIWPILNTFKNNQ